MNKLFAGIQIPEKAQEFIPLSNIDFEQDVEQLKALIAEKINFDANNLEIVYDGKILSNDLKLKDVENMKSNVVVHCFKKTKQYVNTMKCLEPIRDPEFITNLQEGFMLITRIQINVSTRVTILQKILNEYPEFRRNLGAQTIIRDSVLFNTIHHPESMKKIAENYPIICEAAPFIVNTIKKELTRETLVGYSDANNESPNSSEEENSLGASSSNESGTPANQNEESRIRAITRQQLQDALAQVGAGGTNANSVNSLSSIAQRNVDSNASAAPLSSSASGDRISFEMFRQHMARAFNSLGSSTANESNSAIREFNALGSSTSNESNSVIREFNAVGALTENESNTTPVASSSRNSEVQPMDTTEATTGTDVAVNDDTIPASYRNHEYAEQLRTMAQMGFLNHEENLTFLTLSNGNIGNAINLLMGALN